MEWKFVLLCQMQLRLIGLLPMAISIGCQRDAPRYEPAPIAPTEDRQQSNKAQSNIKESTQSVSNGYRLSLDLSDRINDDVKIIFKHIGWSDLVSAQLADSETLKILCIVPPALPCVQNDFSGYIEAYLLNEKKTDDSGISHRLSSKLVIVFENNQPHKAYDKRRLAGIEFITLRSNPGNSEKHTYALIGFLLHIPKHSPASKEHSIRFIQSGKKWYFNKGNSKGLIGIPTQEAIQLASERGTIFFYKKIT